MRELYRRAGALLFFLLALGAFLSLREMILRVTPVDMGEEYRRAYAPVQGWGATAASRAFLRDTRAFIPLPVFIDRETEGRKEEVFGPSWEGLFGALFEESSQEGLLSRKGENDYDRENLYFIPSEEPFPQVYKNMKDQGQDFRYLCLYSSRGPQWCALALVKPHEALSRGVSSSLLRPYRWFSPLFLLLSLGIYFLGRRRNLSEDTLSYAPWGSVYLPDILGFLLSGLFFGAPFLMVPEIFHTSHLLSFAQGSLYFTLFWWFLAALSAALLWVSAKYAAFWLRPLSERLEVHTLRREWNLSYKDILRVEFKDYRPSKGLRLLMRLGSLLEPRLFAQSLLLESRRDWGMRLALKNGESLSFLCSGLSGVTRLFEALEKAGVPLSEELRHVVEGIK